LPIFVFEDYYEFNEHASYTLTKLLLTIFQTLRPPRIVCSSKRPRASPRPVLCEDTWTTIWTERPGPPRTAARRPQPPDTHKNGTTWTFSALKETRPLNATAQLVIKMKKTMRIPLINSLWKKMRVEEEGGRRKRGKMQGGEDNQHTTKQLTMRNRNNSAWWHLFHM